ncbi:MAG: response regulator [Thermoplasmatota archaeon]
MNKRKVMVVDDEQDIQYILTRYLERMKDVEVITALTGGQAVEKYRELLEAGETPALVVMDLNLSGANQDMEAIEQHRKGEDSKMDGVEATRTIKDMDAAATIWGYTAWQGSGWDKELREQGVDKVVGRQVTFKDFAEQVADFLQREE